MEDRKQKEALFHNKREEDHLNMTYEQFMEKYPNKRFYSVANMSKSYTRNMFKQFAGKKVLDYCCGLGGISIQLAKAGAIVTGIDISEESVKTATMEAERAGVSEKCTFIVGDAENSGLEGESFDCIVCSGVLHHLDLDAAYKEISRLLKKDGIVIGMEALAHNPIFMRYRRNTPQLRTEWEVNHILRVSDIKRASKYFEKIKIKYFHLTVLAAVPFRNTFLFKPLRAILNAVDSVILKIPGIQKLAWQGIFTLSNKR